jgi:peptidoglycan/LPS O-acetylase OafA/YrhL
VQALVSLFSQLPPYDGEDGALMLSSFGAGLGDLGDYETCANLAPVANYAWAGPSLNTSVGLCVPRVCDAGTLPGALALFASVIPALNGTNITTHVVQSLPGLDGAAVATLVLLALLGAAVVLATVEDIRYRLRRDAVDPAESYNFLVAEDEDEAAAEQELRRRGGYDDGGDTPFALRYIEEYLRPPWYVPVFSPVYGVQELLGFEAPAAAAGGGADKAGPLGASGDGHSYGAADAAAAGGGVGGGGSSVVVAGARGEFAVLSGLRAILMLWVILGSTFLGLGGIVKNPNYLFRYVVRRFSFQLVVSAELAVDGFFFLSGFLAARFLLRLLVRRGSVPLLLVYSHRVLRLLPALAATLFFYFKLSPYLENGPLWFEYTERVQATCGPHWFTTLLFVQNYAPSRYDEVCMPWSWFLAVDLQMFLFAPPLLWLYHRAPRAGAAVLALLYAGSVAANAALTAALDLTPNRVYYYEFEERFDRFQNYVYTKPWTRAPPYLLGIAAFLLYRRMRPVSRLPPRDQVPRSAQAVGFMLAVLFVFLAVFGAWRDYATGQPVWGATSRIMWVAFSPSVFAVGVAVLVLLCLLGRGGYLNNFLASRAWAPVARLCFCAYLVHPVVINVVALSSGSLFYYRDISLAYQFVTNVILSFACALVLFLVVERPCAVLQRVFERRCCGPL